MSEGTLFLDEPPDSWRSRRITVEPKRRYAEVVLDRDGYVLAHRGEASVDLSQDYVDAISQVQSACADRIWLDGYSGGFSHAKGPEYVDLPVPYPYVDAAVEALRAAEAEADLSGLLRLAKSSALPIDSWLSPGERFLRRGADFEVASGVFLRFLREKAAQRGLRLNGRSTPEGVWVRPQLSADERAQREAHPEQYVDNPDRWSGAGRTDGPRRPLGERERGPNRSEGATPVDFFSSAAGPSRDCSCGSRHRSGHGDFKSHETQHLRWSLGVRIPGTVAWGVGDIALVTTTSSVRWRRLTREVARAPQRENGYDQPSWDVGERPEHSPIHRRAYLMRFDAYVIGYLVAADRPNHFRWDFGVGRVDPTPDLRIRPSLDLIWIAASHRRQGLGKLLVERFAADARCDVADISWSWPLSEHGKGLVRNVATSSVWVHR